MIGHRGPFSNDAGMAGKTDTVICTWRRRLTHVPIPMAVSSRKKAESIGYLWQTVLSMTGRTDDLLTAASGETHSTAPRRRRRQGPRPVTRGLLNP